MLNQVRSDLVPTSLCLQVSMREFENLPNMNMNMNVNLRPVGLTASAAVMPVSPTSMVPSCSHSTPATTCNWRQTSDELRRLRSRIVVLIERMLRNHQPHDVLTQVPENTNWRSKTFVLALKIERLMFLAAPSRENYLNEQTLRSRVQLLSRHLVRIRKRKNAVASLLAPTA